ncbi:hypothetical protein BDZ91DRAFT_715477 [Kalaharituber pfeilii]|nr:hypothetical protein BDZ91DRAFT_715477 [Kalaharituber pfeilii]
MKLKVTSLLFLSFCLFVFFSFCFLIIDFKFIYFQRGVLVNLRNARAHIPRSQHRSPCVHAWKAGKGQIAES